ncbi:MAG: hypothetical protein ACP5EQ_05685 [Candidatus Cloacimonadia bacterium]
MIDLRIDRKERREFSVPPQLWLILVIAAIFGIVLSRQCRQTHYELLEIKNVAIESSSPTLAQIYFEIENKANFSLKKRVVVRLFSDNLEVGSKMILAEVEPQKTRGFLVTINLIKALAPYEKIDEISVRFYD